MKSIEQQIGAMETQWPQFRVTDFDRTERTVVWEGPLAPDKREHLVRVTYRIPLVIENVSLKDAQPRVRVLRPLLERHADYEEGPIPHVYVSEEDPSLPYLCLFSPDLREWGLDDYIAHTTVFWACEWLYFYEGWLLTKKWHGGGRHVRPAVDDLVKRLATV
jgi:hypothetical protein